LKENLQTCISNSWTIKQNSINISDCPTYNSPFYYQKYSTISQNNTGYREAVMPKEKLDVCLRLITYFILTQEIK
jgi:hypothetical protein